MKLSHITLVALLFTLPCQQVLVAATPQELKEAPVAQKKSVAKGIAWATASTYFTLISVMFFGFGYLTSMRAWNEKKISNEAFWLTFCAASGFLASLTAGCFTGQKAKQAFKGQPVVKKQLLKIEDKKAEIAESKQEEPQLQPLAEQHIQEPTTQIESLVATTAHLEEAKAI